MRRARCRANRRAGNSPGLRMVARPLYLPLVKRLQQSLAPLGHFSAERLMRFDLDPPFNAPPARIPLSIKIGTEADLDTVISCYRDVPHLFLADEYPVHDGKGRVDIKRLEARAHSAYLDRFRRGELCFLAESEGELAHLNWSLFQWGELVGSARIRPRPSEAYTTDGLTLPKFRGKGVHAAVLGHMLTWLKMNRYQTAFTLVPADGVAARKGLDDLGWTTHMTFFFWQRHGTNRGHILCLPPRQRVPAPDLLWSNE